MHLNVQLICFNGSQTDNFKQFEQIKLLTLRYIKCIINSKILYLSNKIGD